MATVPLRAGELARPLPRSHAKGRMRRFSMALCATAGLGFIVWGAAPSSENRAGGNASAVASIVEVSELPLDHALTGDAVTRFCILLLEEADRKLAGVSDFRATFHKRERVDGELTDLHVMQLKVRRAPLSVYMRWREPHAGREIIWQQDANDGQILAHAGGWQKKIVPLLRLDPQGDRAMEGNRRPINEIGLWNFNARLLENLRAGQERTDLKAFMTQDRKIGGRPTYCFQFQHHDWENRAPHHKSQIYVDQALGLPIACELYGWPEKETDEPPLEESFAFNDLELNVALSDVDFDIANPDYEFRVRRKKPIEQTSAASP